MLGIHRQYSTLHRTSRFHFNFYLYIFLHTFASTVNESFYKIDTFSQLNPNYNKTVVFPIVLKCSMKYLWIGYILFEDVSIRTRSSQGTWRTSTCWKSKFPTYDVTLPLKVKADIQFSQRPVRIIRIHPIRVVHQKKFEMRLNFYKRVTFKSGGFFWFFLSLPGLCSQIDGVSKRDSFPINFDHYLKIFKSVFQTVLICYLLFYGALCDVVMKRFENWTVKNLTSSNYSSYLTIRRKQFYLSKTATFSSFSVSLSQGVNMFWEFVHMIPLILFYSQQRTSL